jgi:hypothetical protein
MAKTNVRVVGSGYSTFLYKGKHIAWLEQVEDSGQRAFSDAGAPYQFIQPIGHRRPKEIAVSRVLQGGTLNLTIRELWHAPVWNQLAGLDGTNNILDVFARLADDPSVVQCQTIIKPPNGSGRWRGKTYHNCVVVDISDNDTITVGGLAVTKGLVVAYTHSTKL